MIGGSRQSVNRLLADFVGAGPAALRRRRARHPRRGAARGRRATMTEPRRPADAADPGDPRGGRAAARCGRAARAAAADEAAPDGDRRDVATVVLDAQAASIALHDPAPTGSSSSPPPARQRRRRRAGHRRRRRHRRLRVHDGQPLAVADVSADPRFDRTVAEPTGYVPGSIARGAADRRRGHDRRPGGPRPARRDRSRCATSTGRRASPGRRRSPSAADALARRRGRAPPQRLASLAAHDSAAAGAAALDDATVEALVGAATAALDAATDDPTWRAGRSDRPPARRRPGSRRARGRLARRPAPAAAERSRRSGSPRLTTARSRPGASRSPRTRATGSARPPPFGTAASGRASSAMPTARASPWRSSTRASTADIRPSAAALVAPACASTLDGEHATGRRRRRRDRPRRPRHGVRRDRRRHRARRPSSSRSASSAPDNRGKGRAVAAAVDVGHRGGDRGREPEPVVAQRGDVRRVPRAGRPGLFRERPAGLRRQQRPGPVVPVAVRGGRLGRGARRRRIPDVWFYNPAPPVEFGAYGVDVDVAWRDGGRIRATGNSFAAPHIAGTRRACGRATRRRRPSRSRRCSAATADRPG